jgi:flavin-dependent dehydrogenase
MLDMNPRRLIAIAGGGPAGSLAGALLSAEGYDVHIFDEKLAWEKPCGGGLTYKALRQYPFLVEAGGENKSAEGKSAASKSAASNSIDHCELISPSGKRVRFRMQHPVAIFSRLALNGLLLERAQSAGATVRCERVTKIEGSAATITRSI